MRWWSLRHLLYDVPINAESYVILAVSEGNFQIFVFPRIRAEISIELHRSCRYHSGVFCGNWFDHFWLLGKACLLWTVLVSCCYGNISWLPSWGMNTLIVNLISSPINNSWYVCCFIFSLLGCPLYPIKHKLNA